MKMKLNCWRCRFDKLGIGCCDGCTEYFNCRMENGVCADCYYCDDCDDSDDDFDIIIVTKEKTGVIE